MTEVSELLKDIPIFFLVREKYGFIEVLLFWYGGEKRSFLGD